jgi:hypothetical protein
MSTEDNTTPEQEVNQVPEETVNDEQVTEETIGDTLGDTQAEEATKEKSTEVPIARLNKEIDRRKALEKELEDLKSTSEPENESEVKALADKISKIEKKEAAAFLEEKLNEALDEAPEYKNIVNKDVIKQMAVNNQDKTWGQLLDEAYGNALGGKRTVESTTPRGGAKDTKVDLERAQRDAEYRKSVLRDPDLKKQYNEGLEHRINL